MAYLRHRLVTRIAQQAAAFGEGVREVLGDSEKLLGMGSLQAELEAATAAASAASAAAQAEAATEAVAMANKAAAMEAEAAVVKAETAVTARLEELQAAWARLCSAPPDTLHPPSAGGRKSGR